MNNLSEQIRQLCQEKNAIIMAHYYQRPEIQDVADFVGDSLALAQQAAKTNADIIVMCGVHFMAETAKILCPDKKVLIPAPEAGCSLADSCKATDLAAWKAAHPDHMVVSYVNTSAAVNNDNSTVGNASSLQNFTGEIQITGGVDDIDLNILPHQGSDRSGNRDVASCLLGVVVANSVSGANVAQTVGLFCNIEHCLCQGGLSATAVTQQCDISNVLGFNLSHGNIPVFL